MFLIASVYTTASAPVGGFDIMNFLPIILIFGVFYFLILRPQQTKAKQHQQILAGLRRGDRVATTGGILGVVSKIINDHEVQLEIDEGVKVRLVRSSITEVMTKVDPVSEMEKIEKNKTLKKDKSSKS